MECRTGEIKTLAEALRESGTDEEFRKRFVKLHSEHVEVLKKIDPEKRKAQTGETFKEYSKRIDPDNKIKFNKRMEMFLKTKAMKEVGSE